MELVEIAAAASRTRINNVMAPHSACSSCPSQSSTAILNPCAWSCAVPMESMVSTATRYTETRGRQRRSDALTSLGGNVAPDDVFEGGMV
jgi:hypothetical protein